MRDRQMTETVPFSFSSMAILPAMRRQEAAPLDGNFHFRAASIREAPLYAQFTSEATRRSIGSSSWVADRSAKGGAAEVFVCEACGGANPAELVELVKALNADGQRVIVVWTDDWPFPLPSGPDCLVFDVSAPAPFTCTYTWETASYGPRQIESWKPFDERPLLASFVGSRKTHKVRESMFDPALALRPDIVIEDVDWWGSMGVDGGHEFRVERARRFGDVLANSKFALCPRGNGPSSKRRWEAGYMGAIPILIDDLTTPFGVQVPGIDIRPDPSATAHGLAMTILEQMVAVLPFGAGLQQELRDCLLTRFDVPAVWPGHTTARLIIEQANRAWIAGSGFAAFAR